MQRRADIDRIRWIDCPATFLNVLNLAFLVHDEGRAAGELGLFVENSVSFRNFSLHVTEERELHPDFLGECCIRGGGIDADAKHGRVIEIDFA